MDETLAATPEFAEADLVGDGDGWLPRLSRLAGAPLCVDLYLVQGGAGASGPVAELDALALASIYGQVIWDDRMASWHAMSGRPDSAQRMRELHDLALRCHRRFEEGERLVLVRSGPAG